MTRAHMSKAKPEPNDRRVHVQMPGWMHSAVISAALDVAITEGRAVSVAEYIRRAITEKLEREGSA